MAATAQRPAGTAALRRRRRSDAARSIDEAILDAGLEALIANGPDGIGLTDVARRAGYTYGAAYARYENARELLVDLWVRRLRDEFAAWASAIATVRDRRGDAEAADGAFGSPSPTRLAAIGTLIASARIDELSEVIPLDVRRILEESGVESDPLAVGLMAAAIGGAVYASVNGPLDLRLIGLDAGLRSASTRSARTDAAVARPSRPRPVPPIRFRSGDQWRDAVFAAAYEVVAKSGVAGVTLRRIARLSGYDPTSLYSRYPGLAALLTDVMRHASASENAAERIGALMASEDSIAAHCACWVVPGSVTRRRFVLEIHLVTLHDQAFLHDLVAEDVEADRETARRLFPSRPEDEALARVQLWVSLGVGVLLLSDIGVADGVDWRPFARLIRAD